MPEAETPPTPEAGTPQAENAQAQSPTAETPLLPLLELRDPLPEVTTTDAQLAAVAERMAGGTGPVAIDAERASGYRYSSRAYLIQLRREGSGTALVDPTQYDDLAPLARALEGAEWILHAATQDLACLREVGLRPTRLFDTELAARLLGYPRVGLATLVELLVGQRMRKEHSAADWSTRPLPESWLEYAALDVEVLVEIRNLLDTELVEQGKDEWARQEFEALLDFSPAVRTDPWRRTSGMHRARGRRAVAAVRELWSTRDELAAQRDVTPGRLIPDSAIVAAANALPRDRRSLLTTPGFHGRAAERYATRWVEAISRARELEEADLPPATLRSDGPPPPRLWRDRDRVAAGRLSKARAALSAYSGERRVPVENLMVPDTVRRVLWSPPQVAAEELEGAVADELASHGARQWQIDIVGPLLADAIAHPDSVEDRVEVDTPTPEADSGS